MSIHSNLFTWTCMYLSLLPHLVFILFLKSSHFKIEFHFISHGLFHPLEILMLSHEFYIIIFLLKGKKNYVKLMGQHKFCSLEVTKFEEIWFACTQMKVGPTKQTPITKLRRITNHKRKASTRILGILIFILN